MPREHRPLGALSALKAVTPALTLEWQEGRRLNVTNAPKSGVTLRSTRTAGDWFRVEGDFMLDDGRVLGIMELVEAMANRAAFAKRPQPPVTLNAELRPYQRDGYRWLSRLAACGFGACLADDMGLGKTVQVIALLLERAANGASLVFAPSSVCGNWRRELRRFAPTLNPLLPQAHHGPWLDARLPRRVDADPRARKARERLPGGRRGFFRDLAQGGRHGTQPDRGGLHDPARPVVESRRGEPGGGPRPPHRPAAPAQLMALFR